MIKPSHFIKGYSGECAPAFTNKLHIHVASWNGYPNAEKSSLIDERDLSKRQIENSIEKANNIYQKIRNRQKIKAK